MISENLGRLEPVDLREVWQNEADNFTPWLAKQENLDNLGETLGIQVEFQAREEAVGPYSADILCRDIDDGSYVVIENQLEDTNHDHLGKLLTYAAHFKASTMVWVARAFSEQHRAAIDWLNETSVEGTQFFALEIEVWRIGESAYAPKFNIVAKPNNWTRGGRSTVASLTETQRVQLEFWRGFEYFVLEHGHHVKLTATPKAKNSIAAGRLGFAGFLLCAVASTHSQTKGWKGHELRVELTISRGELSALYYDSLQYQKSEIEQEMGEELNWYNPKDANTFRIYCRRDVDLLSQDAHSVHYTWLLDQLENFHRVFAERNLVPAP